MTEKKIYYLDEKKRLSQSKLWDLQRDYYDKVGVNAWRKKVVPHVITSNVFNADQYARLVYAFLRDWEAEIDKDYPVYLIELGTGSGRFSYHFMRRWLDRVEKFGDLDITFKYILTDFTESNLKFWKNHPLMKEMVQNGIAEFALFDATQDTELHLVNSGETLNAETNPNPMIVVANYLFDSIPSDVFYVEDDQLHESLVTLESEFPADHPTIMDEMETVQLRYDNEPIGKNYYANPLYNDILESYCTTFKKTSFLFPVMSLECLSNLQSLCDNRMLLLAADKGFVTVDAMDLLEPPKIAFHGSLSMMVNFDALKQFFTRQEGQWYQIPFQPNGISVQIGLLGKPQSEYRETAMAFYDSIGNYGADDYQSVTLALHQHYEGLSIPKLLSVMRMGRWDATIFEECFPHLLSKVQETTDELRADVRLALHNVWEHYYFIGEDSDIPFMIGAILHNIGSLQEAIILFNYSLEMHGMDPGTLYNMGMSYLYLGDTQQALALIGKAADSGQFPKAVETREMILAKLNEAQ